jgi:hypothetical protein
VSHGPRPHSAGFGRVFTLGFLGGALVGIVPGLADGDDVCEPGAWCLFQISAEEKALAGGRSLRRCRRTHGWYHRGGVARREVAACRASSAVDDHSDARRPHRRGGLSAALAVDDFAMPIGEPLRKASAEGTRRSEPCALGEDRAAIAADPFHAGTDLRPWGEALGAALRQEIDDGAPLQIAEQGAVGLALPPGLLVRAETAWRRDLARLDGRVLPSPEHRVRAHAEA